MTLDAQHEKLLAENAEMRTALNYIIGFCWAYNNRVCCGKAFKRIEKRARQGLGEQDG